MKNKKLVKARFVQERYRNTVDADWAPQNTIIRCENCHKAVNPDGKTFCPDIGKGYACEEFGQGAVNPLALVQSSRILSKNLDTSDLSPHT